MPKLIQYRNNCIGCGICQERQPQYWRMSKKDGKASLLKAQVKKEVHMIAINESELQECQSVALACPARVIKVM